MGNVIDSLKELVKARQHNRILRLSFPNNDGPECEFVVESLEAVESLSRAFDFTVEILSDNPTLALKDLQGKLLSVELVQKGGNHDGNIFTLHPLIRSTPRGHPEDCLPRRREKRSRHHRGWA